MRIVGTRPSTDDNFLAYPKEDKLDYQSTGNRADNKEYAGSDTEVDDAGYDTEVNDAGYDTEVNDDGGSDPSDVFNLLEVQAPQQALRRSTRNRKPVNRLGF